VISLALPPEERQKVTHLYWNRSMVRRLRETIRVLDPDLIHFHIIQRRSFSLASLLLSRRRRAFWTIHDQWPLCVRSVPQPPSCEGMKRFCVACSAWPGFSIVNKAIKEAVFAASRLEVVVPSRWLGDLLRYSFLGRKPVHLVYNGIDLDRFRPAPAGEGAARAQGAATILFLAGPNNPTKGLTELLAAYRSLRARHPGVRLRVVGDPPEGLDSGEGIDIVGRVPREALPGEYRRSDLFVLPTLADNTPVTLMEAMASGLPSVATAVGGIPELVEPGRSGLLVPAGDIAALASAVDGLVADGEARRRMGMAARQAAEAKFSKVRMVQELETIYGRSSDRSRERVTLPAPAALTEGRR
jgi:glycosyltransferase involved in cell wall biosynthesis